MCCLLFHSHLFFELENSTWSYERSLLEAAEETMSSGSEALLFLRESGFTMELSLRANCEICVSELFQGESDEAIYEVLRRVNCSWTVLFADPRGLGSYTVWPRPVSYPMSNNIHRTTFI